MISYSTTIQYVMGDTRQS